MTLPALATLVLQVLDAQKVYFRSHSTTDLIFSKGLEREMRKVAEEVLTDDH